jgi:hypothetical protein
MIIEGILLSIYNNVLIVCIVLFFMLNLNYIYSPYLYEEKKKIRASSVNFTFHSVSYKRLNWTERTETNWKLFELV